MVAYAPAGAPTPRLSPFAFPSDTSFRFVLLIVFVTCSSLSLYSVLWDVLHRSQSQALDTAVHEMVRRYDLGTCPAGLAPCLQGIFQVKQPYDHAIALWKLSGVAATLTLAAVIYWVAPAWKIRRRGLQPLSIDEVTAYLQQLRREVGLSSAPFFLWAPLNSTSNAVAFGRLGRYYIDLSGGLVAQYYTDRPAFRAVVLHEFAHLHNADINKTCFTVALWQAFLVTSIVPVGASLLWRSLDWDGVYTIVWHSVVALALVLLTRNAVLRVREFHADLRASAWEGLSGSLARVLERLPPSKAGRWRAWLRVHPDPGERARLLEDSYPLFRFGFWEAFGAGLAAMFASSSIQLLIMFNPFAHGLNQQPTHLFVLLAVVYVGVPLLCLSLAVAAVGIGVWREEFAALMRGYVPHEAGRLGLALALGMLCYTLLSNIPVVFLGFDPGSFSLTLSLGPFFAGLLALVSTLLVASAFLIFRWTAAAASVWLEVALRTRSPRLPLALSLVVGNASLTLWVVGSMMLLELIVILMWHPEVVYRVWRSWNLREIDLNVPYFTFVTLPGMLVLMSAVGLWAFPLAASFWRNRVAAESTSTWACLDGPLNPLPLPRPPLRPGLALTIGLVAGLLFCMLSALLLYSKYIMPPEIMAEIRSLVLSVERNFLGHIVFLLSALMQATAAAIAAVWIRRLGTLHGLFSAFTAGFVSALGWVLLSKQDDGIVYLFLAFMSPGMVLALPTALGLSALRGRK